MKKRFHDLIVKLFIKKTDLQPIPEKYVDTPCSVKNIKWSCFFGIVKIKYHVEQRYPDNYDCSSKYKHFLDVFVLGIRFNWTYRTKHLYEELPWMD